MTGRVTRVTGASSGIGRELARPELAGKRVVVPGLQNRLNAVTAPRAPRPMVLAIAAKLFEPHDR